MPTQPDVSFIIPIGPYHEALADRAIDSAKAQTVASSVIWVHDTEGKGPSWARNRGLERVKTPFVVFLDADDWVEPNFVKDCLNVWQRGRYVYTDWYVGAHVQTAPRSPWCDNGEWHVITTLLPKYVVDGVGGFTEMPGAEDTEFYWAVTRKLKCCGIHLPEPLFHYGAEGTRAKQFVHSDQYAQVMGQIVRSYGRMGCCADQIIQAPQVAPDGQPGDILVRAIWGGNQVKQGQITGRMYPRAGNGRLMYVDPADAAKRPDWWQPVDEPRPQVASANGQPPPRMILNGLDEIGNALFPNAYRAKPQLNLQAMQALDKPATAPDVPGIVEKARRVYE